MSFFSIINTQFINNTQSFITLRLNTFFGHYLEQIFYFQLIFDDSYINKRQLRQSRTSCMISVNLCVFRTNTEWNLCCLLEELMCFIRRAGVWFHLPGFDPMCFYGPVFTWSSLAQAQVHRQHSVYRHRVSEFNLFVWHI